MGGGKGSKELCQKGSGRVSKLKGLYIGPVSIQTNHNRKTKNRDCKGGINSTCLTTARRLSVFAMSRNTGEEPRH